VVFRVDQTADEYHELHSVRTEGSPSSLPIRSTPPTEDAGNFKFSPDGATIAFRQNALSAVQLHTAPTDGSSAATFIGPSSPETQCRAASSQSLHRPRERHAATWLLFANELGKDERRPVSRATAASGACSSSPMERARGLEPATFSLGS